MACSSSVSGEFAVRDNRQVTTLERGTLDATSLTELDHDTAVNGSGGGYLSNEISYRAINWLGHRGLVIPCGHIHTPRIAGYDAGRLRSIVAQTLSLVRNAVVAL